MWVEVGVGGWRLESGGWRLEVGEWRLEDKMTIKSYRDLEVYQRAKALVVPIHELANSLPPHERFDLADQIRRASKSVVANIVEGYSHSAASSRNQKLAKRPISLA